MSWTELKVESQVNLKDNVVADVFSSEITKLLGAGGEAIKEKKLFQSICNPSTRYLAWL